MSKLTYIRCGDYDIPNQMCIRDSCYAVGAEKALLQAVFRVCIWRGKGFIPYPPKLRFYCVTNPKQRSYELWQFSEWNETRAIP